MDDSRSNYLKNPRNENVFEVEEIFTNILLKLPVKSLLICKSVCKYWKNLISSRSFIHIHLIQSQQNPTYIFYPSSFPISSNNTPLLTKIDGETTQTFPIRNGHYFKRMLCSFNGLVCCTIYATYISYNVGYGRSSVRGTVDIYICNPATQEVLLLPPTSVFECPQIKYVPKLGVSFRSTINGYKVFQFLYGEKQGYECMVYSSMAGSWKSIGCFAHGPNSLDVHACVNGTTYWFNKSRAHGQLVGYIVAVDWEENFSRIGIPEEESTSGECFLINLEGCLCMVVVAKNGPSQCRFDIWGLVDGKESVWVKKLSDYIPIFCISAVRYVAVRRNEILFGNTNEYLFYNIESRSWRRKCNCDYIRKGRFSLPIAYSESLFPCKH